MFFQTQSHNVLKRVVIAYNRMNGKVVGVAHASK